MQGNQCFSKILHNLQFCVSEKLLSTLCVFCGVFCHSLVRISGCHKLWLSHLNFGENNKKNPPNFSYYVKMFRQPEILTPPSLLPPKKVWIVDRKQERAFVRLLTLYRLWKGLWGTLFSIFCSSAILCKDNMHGLWSAFLCCEPASTIPVIVWYQWNIFRLQLKWWRLSKQNSYM